MKNIIIIISLFISVFTFGQCAKLYVKDEIIKFPLCNLSKGDYIEICVHEKKVHACQYNFNYYKTGVLNGSLTYELFSLDGSSQQMTLMVNPDKKIFSFVLGGLTGMYSYDSEDDIRSKREKERTEYEKMKLIDKTKHKEINDLFSQGKIIDAYLKMNRLNAPNEYPNYSEINNLYKKILQKEEEEEDKKTKNDITKFLKSKNTILDAAKKYSTLNSGDVSLQKQINDSIEKYYGDETIEISKEKLDEIINLNKLNLIPLNNGKYKIIMNKNGDLSIQNQNIKLNKMYQSESKNYSSFVIPLNSQGEIQIKTDTSAIAGQEIRKQTFDGCKIYKNIFGQPFRYKILKGSWIGALIFGSEKTESNNKLLKKDLIYVKKSNVKKYANSLLIKTSEIDIVQKQEKLHNRIPKVIWRSTVLTLSALWISLRSYEFSKIN